ncbi:hypothetical protein Tco_1053722 [Tanacetum coccineum]|uniref:Uncharacterized protein n=1 Tax=Tanacetum coccineum TaxID=301880 RepID=A0ABQ5GWB4_9ASTR
MKNSWSTCFNESKMKNSWSTCFNESKMRNSWSTCFNESKIDDTSTNVVCDTPSPADVETRADTEKSSSQAGSRPLVIPEFELPPDERPGDQTLDKVCGLAEDQNNKPMHEDFIATVYPKVHESLKHTTEEHVFLENPPRSSGTLSSLKNLDDAFTFGD